MNIAFERFVNVSYSFLLFCDLKKKNFFFLISRATIFFFCLFFFRDRYVGRQFRFLHLIRCLLKKYSCLVICYIKMYLYLYYCTWGDDDVIFIKRKNEKKETAV